MRRYDGLLGVISIVLVISMLIGLASVLVGAGFSEPDYAFETEADPLLPETQDGGGAFAGEKKGDNEETLPLEETQNIEKEQEEQRNEQEPPEESEEDDPQEEQTDDKSDDTEQGPDENVGGTDPGDTGGGHSDSNTDGEGIAGDDGNGTGEGEGTPGTGDDDSLKIVTDLRSQQITRTELPDGIFKFYAYPSKDDDDLSIKVVINNSSTPFNGSVINSTDGINYEAALMMNETNIFTLYLKQNEVNVSYVRYYVRYEMEKADEDNPEVGEHPPTIITNLDGFTGVMETQGFVFWVSARTNPDGRPIYSNCIEVWLNGELIPKHTGDIRPEYELYFEPPNVGDYAQYTVKVRAWDDKGNSTMKIYTFDYHTISEGDYLGNVTITLDATTVGLGVIDYATYEIFQGDTVADVVIKFLEEYGYYAIYDGSATVGFYLRRIERGDLCRGAKVPDNLWKMILRDGITLTSPPHRDSLGEYDYTMGSGWMYSIDGSVYPGRGMSNYQAYNGMTISLRFTLSYGKDIGGYDATGGGYGSLSSYCGVWINNGYVPLGHDFIETDRVEATETQDGYIEYTCSKCNEVMQEILPMTGEPEEPETPGEPEEPEEPETPEEPEEPEEPDEPEEPEEPDEPEEPEEPDEPEEPEEPEEPDDEGGE